MQLLYSLGIHGYGLFLRTASLFNKKARLWVRGRNRIFRRMDKAMKRELSCKEYRPVAWFHCASLGEFEQGRPLIETFRKDFPNYLIVLTFFSPSGFEYRKTYSGANLIFYLPLDTERNARRFLDIVHPNIAFFVKYEFWFNYLKIMQKRKIPHYLVSAIFRPSQHFFRFYGIWPRNILKGYTHIFVQNEESKKLLQSVGIEKVTISGDTRFDRVAEIASVKREFPLLDLFCESYPIMVAGSTWPRDEEILFKFIRHFSDLLRLIIAPHEIQEDNIQYLVHKLGGMAVRYSCMTPADAKKCSIVIIDSVGQLSQLYRFGQFAYVGGGFGAGIHNILEPAVYGMPIFFGPNYEKFYEARELLRHGSAHAIYNYDDFEMTLRPYFSSPRNLEKASSVSRRYVTSKLGATRRILSNIKVPDPLND